MSSPITDAYQLTLQLKKNTYIPSVLVKFKIYLSSYTRNTLSLNCV